MNATSALPARGPRSSSDYQVLNEVGRGGMGVVYRARHRLFGCVAMKMSLADSRRDPEAAHRFQTEAQVMYGLRHPNIVEVYEVGEWDNLPFFSMEFCRSGSINAVRKGPWPPGEAAAVTVAVAQAMRAAHEANVLHRDLKPSNVLIADDGTPKVTDFGLARRLNEPRWTATGTVLGTPCYMSPEQAEGRGDDVGPWTDVYGVGAVLYELLTGRQPFLGRSVFDTLRLVCETPPTPPRESCPEIPLDLERVCLACLQKDEKSRPTTEQLITELTPFADFSLLRAGFLTRSA